MGQPSTAGCARPLMYSVYVILKKVQRIREEFIKNGYHAPTYEEVWTNLSRACVWGVYRSRSVYSIIMCVQKCRHRKPFEAGEDQAPSCRSCVNSVGFSVEIAKMLGIDFSCPA